MSARSSVCGALCRAVLAAAGTFAAIGLQSWPLATACFAALSVLALGHARALERRARRVWHPEPLTGVGSSPQLYERLHAVAAADPARFALLTLDVDRLKEIHDAHGQLEGDRLLQEVGRVLVENVRDVDGAALLAQRVEEALASIEAVAHPPAQTNSPAREPQGVSPL